MAEQHDAHGQHFYQLRLKCRDTVIDLDSEDPDFIDRQMRKWLGILTEPGFNMSLPLPSSSEMAEENVAPSVLPAGKLPEEQLEDSSARSLHEHLAEQSDSQQPDVPVADDFESSPAVPKHLSGNTGSVLPEPEVLGGSDSVQESQDKGAEQLVGLPEDLSSSADADVLNDDDESKELESVYQAQQSDSELVETSSESLDGTEITDMSERLEPREEELDLVVNSLMEDLQPPPEEVASIVSDSSGALGAAELMNAEETVPDVEAAVSNGGVADINSEAPPMELDVEPVEGATSASATSSLATPSDSAVELAQQGASSDYEVLCNQVGAATSEDFLLMSAYFLTVRQPASPFTLTALNKLITSANFEAVTHAVLATALTKGLLTMVPDVHGTAEATEYEITPHGRSTVEMFL